MCVVSYSTARGRGAGERSSASLVMLLLLVEGRPVWVQTTKQLTYACHHQACQLPHCCLSTAERHGTDDQEQQ